MTGHKCVRIGVQSLEEARDVRRGLSSFLSRA